MRWLSASCIAALLALAPAAVQRPAGGRFLLYDLNAAEGFNLRRDVMLRAALLVSDLGPGWTLVLPPFHRMPQWAHDPGDELMPWRDFFDVSRLAEVVPVVEYQDFVAAHGRGVDRTLVLTADSGNGSDYHLEPRDCASIDGFARKYSRTPGGYRAALFGGGATIETARVDCVASFAPFPWLVPLLAAGSASTTLVDGMTTPFWDARYGGAAFWAIRTRVPFARALTDEAGRFIRATFGEAPYVAVHLRRGDFLRTPRPHPTLDEVVEQLQALQRQSGASRLFLATDAAADEVAYLGRRVAFSRYTPPPGAAAYPDGVLAVLDQIIASRAAWFAGTAGSTFTTTILEEREILGRPPESTYNVLCARSESAAGTAPFVCPRPTRVPIVK